MIRKIGVPALLIFALASCDGLIENLDPKSGIEKLEILLTEGGQWNIDTMHVHTDYFLGQIITDTTYVNFGKFEFQKRADPGEPGYLDGLGRLLRHYTDNGVAKVDSSFYYPENYGAQASGAIDGDDLSLFLIYSPLTFDNKNQYDHFKLIKTEKKHFIIEGGRNIHSGQQTKSVHYRIVLTR